MALSSESAPGTHGERSPNRPHISTAALRGL